MLSALWPSSSPSVSGIRSPGNVPVKTSPFVEGVKRWRARELAVSGRGRHESPSWPVPPCCFCSCCCSRAAGRRTTVQEPSLTVTPERGRAPATRAADGRRAHPDRGRHPRPGLEPVLGDRAHRRGRGGAPDGRAGRLRRARRLQPVAHDRQLIDDAVDVQAGRARRLGARARRDARHPARRSRPASRSSRSTRAARTSSGSACSRTSASRRSRAGLAAGRRLARAGVRRALCVNQQVGNTGPRRALRAAWRARCARAGGTSRVIGIDDQSAATPRRIGAAVVEDERRRRARHQLDRRAAGASTGSRACGASGA